MEQIEIVLSLAATALGLLITALTFIAKFVTNVKAKKAVEAVMQISCQLMPLIQEAENFSGMSGTQKKQYVLEKVRGFAVVNDLPFDSKTISEKIDDLVSLTKCVNRGKFK